MATTRTTPAQFFRQVRQEVSKVTWPTRKETMITTLFFLAVDWGLGNIIDLLVFRR
jgi:preprotein translocase subunit SecE